MRYLTLEQVMDLHRLVIAQSGGSLRLRDLNALASTIAQPTMTFDRVDLYPTMAAKAGALAHSLIQNHPVVHGTKRIGHAAMEVFLVLNGLEIDAAIDEQETVFMKVASGELSRAELTDWVEEHLTPLS